MNPMGRTPLEETFLLLLLLLLGIMNEVMKTLDVVISVPMKKRINDMIAIIILVINTLVGDIRDHDMMIEDMEMVVVITTIVEDTVMMMIVGVMIDVVDMIDVVEAVMIMVVMIVIVIIVIKAAIVNNPMETMDLLNLKVLSHGVWLVNWW
jgi:hypothetical protein